MDAPQNIPAAWRGDELLSREDWLYTFVAADLEEIEAALRVSRDRGPVQETTAADFPLPRLSARLKQVQHNLERGSGAAMLRGFPVDRYTAQDAGRVFWGLASHVGTPVSQTAAGERMFSVRDEGYAEGDARARGPNTRKGLSFHTDRCDVIAFLCLKQAKSGGENEVVSSVTLYNEVAARRPDLLEVLLQPYYYQRHNVDTGNALPYCRQPIFSIYQGHFACNLLRVLIERAHASGEVPPMSDLQREALDYVEQLAEDPALHVRFRQQPGDVLLLNNFVTLHRRAGFTDHADPTLRRHLLRIWLSVPNSRPLHPDFAANYGSTEAGALRGGMRKESRETK